MIDEKAVVTCLRWSARGRLQLLVPNRVYILTVNDLAWRHW